MTEKELKGLGDEIERYGFTSAKTGTALFLAVNHLRALLKEGMTGEIEYYDPTVWLPRCKKALGMENDPA